MPATDEKEIVSPGQSEPAVQSLLKKQTPLKEPQAFWTGDSTREPPSQGQGGRICHVGRRHSPCSLKAKPVKLRRKGSSALQYLKYTHSILI